MKYKIYQFYLTDEIYNGINAGTHADANTAMLQLMLVKKEVAQAVVDIAKSYMEHVADIEAEDLNDVFDVGNIGPEEKITRYKNTTSLSVGNVIVDEDGVANIVCGFGFAEVDF